MSRTGCLKIKTGPGDFEPIFGLLGNVPSRTKVSGVQPISNEASGEQKNNTVFEAGLVGALAIMGTSSAVSGEIDYIQNANHDQLRQSR